MKYERIILLVFFILFALGFLGGYLDVARNWLTGVLFSLTGMGKGSEEQTILSWMITYVRDIVSL